MVIKPHAVNGKHLGAFYELADGRKVYLAHRTPGKMFRGDWLFDEHLLRQLKAQGIDNVGVLVKSQGKILAFLTKLEDFYGPHSRQDMKKAVARALPGKHFRINPATCLNTILRIATVTR